jgi:hypothetical protein
MKLNTNKINNLNKRSNIMKTLQTFRGLFALIALTIMVTAIGFSQGGNVTLYGDVNGGGTMNVNGNLTNAKGANLNINPAVNMRRNTTTQAITNNAGTWTINFTTLRFGRIGNKTIGTTTGINVTSSLEFGYAGANNFMTGNFTLGSNTLTVAAASTYFATSVGALTLNGGTVNYTQIGGSQTLLNYGATYGALGLSGSATKVLPVSGTNSASGTVTHAGSAVTFNENFNISTTGSGSFVTIADIATGKMVDFQGTANPSSITTVSTVTGTLRKSGTQDLGITTVTANPGVIENTGTAGTLTIGTLTANAGTIRNTNTGLVAFTNAAPSNGTISASNGTVTFVNNLSGTGTVSLTGGTMQFGGSVAQGTYTLTAGTTVYNSSTAGQSIVGTTYNNLTLNNASKTLAGPAIITGNLTNDASSTLAMGANNITLSGNLTIASDITNGAGVLTMNSALSNVTGAGLVQGSVRRAHAFAANTQYKFNGQNIYLATAAQPVADVTLKMSAATSPTSPVSSKYANRKYALTIATNPLTLMQAGLYYVAPGEETGGLNSARVGIRFYNGALWSKIVNTGRTSAGGLVTFTGAGQAMAIAANQELGMFSLAFVTAGNGLNIALAPSWDENLLPTTDDDATIAHTGMTMNNPVSVNYMSLNAGTDLTISSGNLNVSTKLDNAGSLTINGGTTNITTDLNVTGSGSTKINTAGNLTVTGTWTNNTTASAISDGTGTIGIGTLANSGTGSLTFRNATTNITSISSNASAINVGGGAAAAAVNVATGAVATISIGGTLLVDNLGTLNIGSAGFASNLTMNNTGTTPTLQVNTGVTPGTLNVYGDLTVNTGVALTNNGTITVGQ